MANYKFRNMENIEDFLLESLGCEMLLPESTDTELKFFHNGDIMTINTKSGTMLWEPISPGSMTTSKLSMRLHQWYGKGIIKLTE